MALWAVCIKRKYGTPYITEALIVDSKTMRQEHYNSKMLIDMLLNNYIQVMNIDIKHVGDGEKRLVLKGNHLENGSNYAICRQSAEGLTEDRLCIVINGYNGVYECIYANPKYEEYTIERIISSTQGIYTHISEQLADTKISAGFKIFNAALSDRWFGNLRQLDIVSDGHYNVETFKMVTVTNKKKKGLFSRKNNIDISNQDNKTQSYFDYGYTCECADDTQVTKAMFEIMYNQISMFYQLAEKYSDAQIPVFSLYNGVINLLAIYKDAIHKLYILKGVERVDLKYGSQLDSLQMLITNSPRGIDFASGPRNLKTLIIVANEGARVRIRSPFWRTLHNSSEIEAIEKYARINVEAILDKFGMSKHISLDRDNLIVSYDRYRKGESYVAPNINVTYYTASDIGIDLKVLKGVQKIRQEDYSGSEIYIIGVNGLQ